MDLLKPKEDGIGEEEQEQLQRFTTSSVANLMREQDADLLASHHAMGMDKEDESEASRPLHTVGEAPMGESALPPSRSSAPKNTAEGVPRVSAQVHSRRPTLSGEIFLVHHTDDQALGKLGESSCENQGDAFDRRISEVAQFVAAVGEVSEGIRIIEDHDDDDDDDDDDNEVETNHEIRSVNSALALSIGDVSLHSVPGTTKTTLTDRSTTASSVPTTPVAIVGRPYKPISTKRGFLDRLPGYTEGDQPTYVYKGIRSNPPEIVRRGIQRGNYAQLHRKAWLEVSDKYHRYGKNLRLYYRHWEKLGCPYQMFFDWLDSKGEAAGQPLPELDECPRVQLDSDVVLYITNPDVTEQYAVNVVVHTETGKGLMIDADGDAIVTGTDGWIFVLRDNRFYAAQKIASTMGERSKQRFHHSSFFGGKAVEAAGIFVTDDEGYLSQLLPHSGHYRPGEAHMQRVLFFLHHVGVDLRTFEMDMQQILHVARDEKGNDGKVEKKKKIESLCLQSAVLAACFLAHKARFIGNGIFQQIHQIRNADCVNVREALALIDADGGQ